MVVEVIEFCGLDENNNPPQPNLMEVEAIAK